MLLIFTYNTATATTVPSAANLAQGELAVNVTDKKLYTKDSGGNVVLLASNGGDVTGPASSTNLAIPTFSGTGGKTLLNNSGVTISAGVITATGFSGPLTGNVTGNVSGSSGSCTGNASTVTTNANLTGPITSVGNATSIASQTGTGTKFVVDTSPTLVTPTIGIATATSINKMAITAPATSSTLAIADGKTHTVNNSIALSGTDSTTMTFPTTSATIARTDAAQTFTGAQTFNSTIDATGKINSLNNALVATNGSIGNGTAIDLTLPSTLGNVGILMVSNTYPSLPAAYHTRTVYAFMSQGTRFTATVIGNQTGLTGGMAFTLSMPSGGVLRVTDNTALVTPVSVSVAFSGTTTNV